MSADVLIPIAYVLVGIVVGGLIAYYVPKEGATALLSPLFWPLLLLVGGYLTLAKKGDARQKRIATEKREQERILRDAGFEP